MQRLTEIFCVVRRSFRLLSADNLPTYAPVSTLGQSPLSHIVHRAEIVTSGTDVAFAGMLETCGSYYATGMQHTQYDPIPHRYSLSYHLKDKRWDREPKFHKLMGPLHEVLMDGD
ncbi:hypothetical protein KCU89_g10, partial [Aureobasidium melanogenum]